MVRLDDPGDQPDNRRRGVKLAALGTFGRSEVAQEVLIDLMEGIHSMSADIDDRSFKGSTEIEV